MSTTERPRVFSHITRTRFLHIEDSLEKGKLRFFVGSFEKGQGMNATAYAFLDIDDARVVMSDLAWGKAVEFVDFKGGRDSHNVLISRVLEIKTKADERKVWIEVQNGPGQEFGEGSFEEGRFAVKPTGNKPSAEISMPLTILEARKMGFACLAYLQAWEVAKMIILSPTSPRA